MATNQIKEDVWIKTFCRGCFNACCGLMVHRVDGVVVGLKGDPDNPYNKGKLCAKAFGQIMLLYDPNRPTKPMIRTNPEKGIGVDPRWKEVSWEEALDLAAKKLAEIRKDNPDDMMFSCNDVTTLIWLPMVIGGSFGSLNWNMNNPDCGTAVHCQPAQTMGSFHQYPDYEYCKYLVLWGSNKGGMVQHLGVTAGIDIADARRKKGMKLVCIDPVQSNIASKANEWIPIMPGTDLAMALAWQNVLLNETGLFDEEHIKRYTNGPYLIKEDGHYLRDEATKVKPLMWDPVEGKAKPFDAEFKDIAIEGNYEVKGIPCRPAFQVLKDHVKPYTPEWAAPITTIPAETIRRLATEFGEAASIGSTIKIEDTVLPYRPAAIHWYSGISHHTNGFMTGTALQTIMVLIGAVNVPGGTVGDGTIVDYPYLPQSKRTLWTGKDGYPTMSEEGLILSSGYHTWGGHFRIGYPARKPQPPEARCWSLFPLSLAPHGFWQINHLHPERFNNKIPRVKLIVGHQCNDLTNNLNPEEMAQVTKDHFRIACEPFMTETAEFADIFFPTPTHLETLQVANECVGYMGGTIGLKDYCVLFAQPVVPQEEIVGKEMIEIWLELAKRVGFVPEYNMSLNIAWDLPEEYRLEPNKEYSNSEIMERAAKGVFDWNLDTFAQEGFIKWPKSVKERYPRPFFEGRSIIYFEHFIDAGKDVAEWAEEQGFEWDVSAYEPLPSWRPPVIFTDTKPGFDLIAIPFRLPVLSHFWMTSNPWLLELAEHHPWGMNIIMNANTAAEHGIKDGDQIVVEGVAGYKQEGKVKLTQCIHPQVVALSKHGGHWASHPVARGKGTQSHFLIPNRLEYMDKLFGDMSICIRAKVTKAAER